MRKAFNLVMGSIQSPKAERESVCGRGAAWRRGGPLQVMNESMCWRRD